MTFPVVRFFLSFFFFKLHKETLKNIWSKYWPTELLCTNYLILSPLSPPRSVLATEQRGYDSITHAKNMWPGCSLMEASFDTSRFCTIFLVFWNLRAFPCQSQWPRGLRRRSTAARLLRLWFRIPQGAWMFVCCDYWVFTGRGLCDELITRPEESYRPWYVVVCDLETSWMRRPWPNGGLSRQKQTNKQRLLLTYLLHGAESFLRS